MGYSSCSIKAGHQIWSFFQHFWFILLYIPCLPLRLKCQSTHLSNPEHVFQIQRSSKLDPKVQNKTFKTGSNEDQEEQFGGDSGSKQQKNFSAYTVTKVQFK